MITAEQKETRNTLREMSRLTRKIELEASKVREGWEAAILDAFDAGWSYPEIGEIIGRACPEMGHSKSRLDQVMARERARRNGGVKASTRPKFH